MAENIKTNLQIQLDAQDSVREAQRLLGVLQQVSKETLGIGKSFKDDLAKNVLDVTQSLKDARVLMTTLRTASQGSLESLIARSGTTAVLNERKGTDLSVGLRLAQDEVSQRRQVLKIGENIVETKKAEAQIQQGLINSTTIQYKLEASLYRIGQLSVENGKYKRQRLDAEIGRYQKLEEQLRQQILLEKESAKVKTQAAIAEEKGSIGTAIHKKSMGELLLIQGKLLLNYKLLIGAIQGFSSAITSIRELDQAFYQLQAIGDLTNSQMVGIRDTILDLGTKSKFSAVEIAQASITLAQAGYSGDQIKKSLTAITLLATAAGTDLKQAVDIATSVVNVFNYQIEQTSQVANVLTAALNQSKLGIEQVGLGIQYASNVAADANISFTEMVASFGVLADAGIKSGSTIGTGYRQLINDFVSPSEKLLARLRELGLGLDTIDVRSKGLAGVIRDLSAAGFTAADAMQTLELRGAATYSALSKGTDAIYKQQQLLLLSQAAVKANDIQMQSFNNSLKQLQNSLNSIAFSISEGLLKTVRGLVVTLSESIQTIVKYKEVFGSLAILLGAGLVASIATSATAIAGLTTVFVGFLGIVGKLASIIQVLQLGFVALLGVNPLTGVLLGVAAAATAAYTAFRYLSGGAESLNDVLDKTDTKINEAKAELDKYEQQGRQVTKFLQELRDQQKELTTNTEALKVKVLEAKSAFDGLGGSVINLGDDYDTLVQKVSAASNAIYKQIAIAAQGEQAALKIRQKDLERQNTDLKGAAGQLPVGFVGLTKDQQALVYNSTKKINDFDSYGVIARQLAEASLHATDQQAETLRKQSELFQQLAGNYGQQAATLRQLGISQDKELDADKEVATGNIVRAVTGWVTGVTKDAGKALGSAATLEDLNKIQNSLDTPLNRFSTWLLQKSSDIGVIGEESSKQIAAAIAGQQTVLDKVGAEKDKVIEENNTLTLERLQTEDRLLSNSIRNQQNVKENLARYIANVKKEQELQDEKAKVDALATIKKDHPELVDKEQINKRAAEIYGVKVENNRIDAQEKIQSMLNAVNRAASSVATVVDQQLVPAVQQLKLEYTAITNATDIAIKQSESRIKSIETQRKSLDEGKNKLNVSDATRYLKDQEIIQLKLNEAKKQAAVYEQEEIVSQKVLNGILLEKARLTALAQSKGFSGADLLRTEAVNGRDAGLRRLASQYAALDKQQLDYEKRSEETKIKHAEAVNFINAYGKGQTETFWETLSNSAKVYLETTNSLANSSYQLDKDLTQIFSNINSEFSNAVRNIVTGTSTIKKSFQEMAKSIVSNMLDIAVKRTSASLFDTLFSLGKTVAGSALGSIVSGSASVDYSKVVVPTDAAAHAQGGIVTGGIPNRDSVPAWLMPGEAVLTTRAVSMLGADTIKSLNNSAGRVQASAPNAYATATNAKGDSYPVNVYVVAPDQKPSLSKNDVVAIISDDIYHNGQTTKLIKSVIRGNS